MTQKMATADSVDLSETTTATKESSERLESLLSTAATKQASRFIGSWVSEYDILSLIVAVTVLMLALGNFGVVAIFIRRPKLRTPFNVLVLAMAIVDILNSYVLLPQDVDQLLNKLVPPAGEMGCKLKVAARAFCVTTILVLMFAVTIISTLAAIYACPPKVCGKKVATIIVISCACSALVAILSMHDNSAALLFCMGRIRAPGSNKDKVQGLYVVAGGILFAIMGVCYIRIFLVKNICWKCQGMDFDGNIDGEVEDEPSSAGPDEVASRREEMKVWIMPASAALVVSLVLMISWTAPFLPGIEPFKELFPPRVTFHARELLNMTNYVHSGLKPLVYLLMSGCFRQNLMQLLPRPLAQLSAGASVDAQ